MIQPKPFLSLFTSILLTLLMLTASGQDPIKATENVIKSLEKDEIGKLYHQLDKSSKKQFSKKQLKQVWKSINNNYGKIDRIGEIRLDTTPGNSGTSTDLFLEKNSLMLMLAFDNDMRISTFRFLPQSYSMPATTKNMVLGKRIMMLETDTFKLSGELIYPLKVMNPPVVIFVHGSGPMDMDATIGPNKIFMDLALVLAQQGVASFRYTKRSKAYPDNFKKDVSFTLADETTDDARSAIRLMLRTEEIDTNKIFVMGHSLGAFAAPKIAAENPKISGIVMMAGPYNPLYELIPTQFKYLFGLEDKNKRIKKMMLKRVDKWADLLRTKNYEELKKFKHSMVYWPTSFFQDLENYSPGNTIDSLSCRTLILQGSRDYQVPFETEFLPFQKRLVDNQLVTTKLFPNLNHLFLYGEGLSEPSEYMKPGNVSPEVIRSISDWIKEMNP